MASPAVVRSALEHAAVRESARAVAREGGRERVVPTDPSGAPHLDHLERLLDCDPEVAVVSFLWVSNEVGTIHPMEALAERTRDAGVPFHSDAVQAVGKVAVDLEAVPVDLLTLTAHKVGGPRGAAALLVREGVELLPVQHGGGQEGGLRPGTQDVAGAVGLAHAVALAVQERESEARRLEELREALARGLSRELPGLRIHGEGGLRAPHILSVGVPVKDGEALLMALDLEGVAASRGSACASGASEAGPVLAELLGERAGDRAPLRFSLGHSTTPDEVERAVPIIAAVVDRIRQVEAGSGPSGTPARPGRGTRLPGGEQAGSAPGTGAGIHG
jgi:cysteine desulfurase